MAMTEMKNQSVIVAGASGVFGRHIREALTDAGHTVLGVGRGEGNEIRADLLDRDGLLRAFEGIKADVVVHAATALRKPPMTHKGMFGTDDLRVTGTANLIEAAKLAGVRRFIGENVAVGYGYRDFGDRVLTEADEFGASVTDPNINRHLEGMREKERLPRESGLEAISLRFGFFYGPGAPRRWCTCCGSDNCRRSTTTVTSRRGRTWPTRPPPSSWRSIAAGPVRRTTSSMTTWASGR